MTSEIYDCRIGDCILQVNDVRTVDVEHSIAVEALKSAGDEVFLVIHYLLMLFSNSSERRKFKRS